MCSDEVEVSADIRPPDEFIDDDPYIPPGTPARPARVEPTTFRYAQHCVKDLACASAFGVHKSSPSQLFLTQGTQPDSGTCKPQCLDIERDANVSAYSFQLA